MLKEAGGTISQKLAPLPSKELQDFNNNVLKGNDPRIPVYGNVLDMDIQCYGIKKGEERQRMIFQWGNIEKSYFITRNLSGEISVFLEGFYRRK